jgi:hypothetical protein
MDMAEKQTWTINRERASSQLCVAVKIEALAFFCKEFLIGNTKKIGRNQTEMKNRGRIFFNRGGVIFDGKFRRRQDNNKNFSEQK